MKPFPAGFQAFYLKHIHFPVRSSGQFAVVFSPNKMLGSGLGETIDSFDSVLRFNAAPTIGFEEDVGGKTTHRIMEPSTRFREKEEECFSYETRGMYSLPFQLRDLEYSKKPENQEYYEHFHLITSQLGVISTDVIYKMSKKYYQSFSTGFLGLFYAIACSKKPSVLFGFETLEERKHSTNGHYYDVTEVLQQDALFVENTNRIVLNRISKKLEGRKKMPERNQVHDFSFEKQIILRLHALKRLQIHGL